MIDCVFLSTRKETNEEKRNEKKRISIAVKPCVNCECNQFIEIDEKNCISVCAKYSEEAVRAKEGGRESAPNKQTFHAKESEFQLNHEQITVFNYEITTNTTIVRSFIFIQC